MIVIDFEKKTDREQRKVATMDRWKHGLTLAICRCDIDKTHVWDKCKDCNDFGEYWKTPDGGIVRMGELARWLEGLTKGTFRGTLEV